MDIKKLNCICWPPCVFHSGLKRDASTATLGRWWCRSTLTVPWTSMAVIRSSSTRAGSCTNARPTCSPSQTQPTKPWRGGTRTPVLSSQVRHRLQSLCSSSVESSISVCTPDCWSNWSARRMCDPKFYDMRGSANISSLLLALWWVIQHVLNIVLLSRSSACAHIYWLTLMSRNDLARGHCLSLSVDLHKIWKTSFRHKLTSRWFQSQQSAILSRWKLQSCFSECVNDRDLIVVDWNRKILRFILFVHG